MFQFQGVTQTFLSVEAWGAITAWAPQEVPTKRRESSAFLAISPPPGKIATPDSNACTSFCLPCGL